MTCKFVGNRYNKAPILTAFGALLLMLSMALQAANPVDLDQMGFFEGTLNSQAPDWGSTEIKTTFPKDSARRIFTLIKLKNNLWLQSDQVFKLTVRYIRSDGSHVGEEVIETRLPTDWESIELRTGLGWDEPDQWDPGFYRVELWLDDTSLLGDSQFFIKADTRTITRAGDIELDQLGFYEGGDEAADNAPDDWTDGRVRNNFYQAESRYIYTLVSINNSKWKVEDQQVNIYIRYYNSSGELIGDPIIEYHIPQDWASAQLWSGWGWSDPGHWEPDRYRVELWLDNNKKIGESHFTIH